MIVLSDNHGEKVLYLRSLERRWPDIHQHRAKSSQDAGHDCLGGTVAVRRSKHLLSRLNICDCSLQSIDIVS